MQIPDEDETDEPESDGSSKKVIIKDAFQRAKNLFAKVFKVIWSFSEFFLPAAGKIPIVGAGVEFLAKAIDLLIQTTRNYREIFLKAAQLFEQVGFFSMRFEMLMEAENAGAQLHPKYVSVFSIVRTTPLLPSLLRVGNHKLIIAVATVNSVSFSIASWHTP